MLLRNLAVLGLVAATVILAGCSCKEFEDQIGALDQQIAGLQEQVVAREADVTRLTEKRDTLQKDLDVAQTENTDMKAKLAVVEYAPVDEVVSFAADEYKVQEAMGPILEAVARKAKEHPDWDLYVVGFTDRQAQNPETQYFIPTPWELAAYRATNVARHLVERLYLPPERVIACSVGSSRLVGANDTEEARALNRRVVFYLRKPEPALTVPAAGATGGGM